MPCGVKRQVELGALAGEVLVELPRAISQHPVLAFRRRRRRRRRGRRRRLVSGTGSARSASSVGDDRERPRSGDAIGVRRATVMRFVVVVGSSSFIVTPSQCRPQMVHRVRPPGPPALGGRGARVERASAWRTRGRRQEYVGVAEPAHHDVVRRPRADARQRRRADRRASSRSAPGSRRSTAGDGRGPARSSVRRRAARHRQRVGSSATSQSGAREHMRQPVVVERQRVADRGGDRAPARYAHRRPTPAGRGSPARRSRGSTEPARAGPGLARRAAERRIVAERLVDGDRVGVEVEQTTDALHGRLRGRASRRAGRATTRRAPSTGDRGRRRCRARAAAPTSGGSVAVAALDARDGTRSRGTSNSCGAANGWRDGSRTVTCPASTVAAPLACGGGARSARRAYTSRTVSLNWRTLPKPAAKATSVMRIVGGLDQRPRGLGALGTGERERAGAELVGQHPVELAHAVAEAAGEAGDALAVDHAVGDQPHRPADEVAADVPLGRSGDASGRQRLHARKPVLLGGGRRSGRTDVRALGRDRRAARPAVDAGRAHRHVEPAVEPASRLCAAR